VNVKGKQNVSLRRKRITIKEGREETRKKGKHTQNNYGQRKSREEHNNRFLLRKKRTRIKRKNKT
jgi:hypothetical protein